MIDEINYKLELWAEWVRVYSLLEVALIGFAIVAVYIFASWVIWGRDKRNGIIVTQDEPLPGVSPALMGMIANMRSANSSLSAAVISLASKQVLKIGRAPGKAEGEEIGRYGVQRTGALDNLPDDERILGNVLFPSKASKLLVGADFVAQFDVARGRFWHHLKSEEADYFDRHQGIIKKAYWLIGLIAGFVLWHAGAGVGTFVVTAVVTVGPWLIVGMIQAAVYGIEETNPIFASVRWLGVVNAGAFVMLMLVGAEFAAIPLELYSFLLATCLLLVTFDHLLRAPTDKGRAAMDHIDGFRRYLETAEKDRMNFHTPPDKTPELYERYLPYAVALGVEHKWAGQFGRSIQIDGFFRALHDSRSNIGILLAAMNPLNISPMGKKGHAFGTLAAENMERRPDAVRRPLWKEYVPENPFGEQAKRRRSRHRQHSDPVMDAFEWLSEEMLGLDG